MDTTAAIPGQLDADKVLDLVLRENTSPGHASLKTPSIALASGPDRQEQVIALRDRRRPILDETAIATDRTSRKPPRGG